jgi:hypothetical protein
METEIQGFTQSAFNGAISYLDPFMDTLGTWNNENDLQMAQAIKEHILDEKKIDSMVDEKLKKKLETAPQPPAGSGMVAPWNRQPRALLYPDNVQHGDITQAMVPYQGQGQRRNMNYFRFKR